MGLEIVAQYRLAHRGATTESGNLLQPRQGFTHAKRKRYVHCRHEYSIGCHLSYYSVMTPPGAALFAKRKQKSEKWIVDENTVKQKTAQAAAVAAAATNIPAVQSSEPSVTTAPLAPNQSRAEQTQKMASVQVGRLFNHNPFFFGIFI